MDAKEALERLYPAMQDAHVQRSKFYAPRGPVKTEADADNDLDLEALAVLRAVVDERDALKAEVERLATEASHHQHDAFYAEQRAEKAEAELAAARPLLDAAKNTEHITDEYGSSAWRGITELKRAALAYRAGRAK